MKEKPLKINDIARETGFPEKIIRGYTEEYKDLYSSRKIGRISVYDRQAVKITADISELQSKGLKKEEIIKKLGRGKKNRDLIERNNPHTKPATRQTSRTSHPATPGALTKNSMIQTHIPAPVERKSPENRAVDHSDAIALQEQQIKRVTKRAETLETELTKAREELSEVTEENKILSAAHNEQIRITGDWIEYFDKKLDLIAAEQQNHNREVAEWTTYIDSEITRLNLSITERLKKKFRI
ncbi:MAG: MerR family transcriptional regulator [Euryarchaeota archaeon]|nr:MerR family transcriptional regulator [Euryarchaeota archaeon]